MNESILNSIKKVLGVDKDYTAFDQDILMHINSSLLTLNQLGIGPEEGFIVENEDTTWSNFIGTDPRLNAVKSYLYLKVRYLFDPPGTSFLLDAMDKQIAEYEWRLNVHRESLREEAV